MPCDSGEGRVKRGAGEEVVVDGEGAADVVAVVTGEVAVVGTAGGVMPGERVELTVAVDDEDEVDPLRWWGLGR